MLAKALKDRVMSSWKERFSSFLGLYLSTQSDIVRVYMVLFIFRVLSSISGNAYLMKAYNFYSEVLNCNNILVFDDSTDNYLLL